MRISDWSSDVCSSDLLGTEWCYEDIIHVTEQANEHLDTIMLPKARCASDLHFVDTLLSQIEKRLKLTKKIGLEVLIEEVDGMRNVNEIAFATPRLEALIFGFGDYSASQGIDPIIRSEEHTSELQSLMRISYAVFCLKKKKKQHT